jgi:uncharacterized protein (DUF488 family)
MKDNNICCGTIFTIGHSTHSQEEFISMLKASGIEVLADIRSFPGSRRYPHFNKEAMEVWLPLQDIRYIHFKDLGGRRKPLADSKNTAWKVPAFRGYADYMETQNFKSAITELENIAQKSRTVYMCSEAVWWSCHRSLVSDYLKHKGWIVKHIMGISKEVEHPYTKAANTSGSNLSYRSPDLFSN